jgi:hypothetical protein
MRHETACVLAKNSLRQRITLPVLVCTLFRQGAIVSLLRSETEATGVPSGRAHLRALPVRRCTAQPTSPGEEPGHAMPCLVSISVHLGGGGGAAHGLRAGVVDVG